MFHVYFLMLYTESSLSFFSVDFLLYAMAPECASKDHVMVIIVSQEYSS